MDEIATAPSVETPQAPVTPEGTPQTVSKERMYTVKANGKEEVWPESKVLERASKAEGAEKAMKEAAQYKTAFENFVARSQNPQELIGILNHPDLKYDSAKKSALIEAMLESGDEAVEEAVKGWLYKKRVVPSQMDPKEREAMEWKEKHDKIAAERAREEKERKDIQDEQEVENIKLAYRTKLGESYLRSGLPQEEGLVRKVMEKARLYIRAGKHPDFDNCCKLVQAEFVENIKNVLGKATVENILSFMDEETPQKINKALMKALEKKNESTPEIGEKSPSNPKRKSKEKTPAEKRQWARNLERGIFE